ncbi:MAG: hypothetical protein D6746_04020 [Bacteroidetes bacterium]|nr:MAG: hypothetical protein D6746_04020 [Bacteroidota bacterium]
MTSAFQPASADEPEPTATVSARTALLLGFVAGLAFGVLLLLGWLLEGLFVLFCGLVGAATGWVIHGARTGTLDVRAAWRALRRS